jgi:hypothetical protein
MKAIQIFFNKVKCRIFGHATELDNKTRVVINNTMVVTQHWHCTRCGASSKDKNSCQK